MTLERSDAVGVVGAGAMGAGIAQVALLAGHVVWLRDVDPSVADRARSSVLAALTRLIEKGRLAADAASGAEERLRVAADVADLRDCRLVIEAVAESYPVKRAVLAELESVVRGDCVLATNTSSLSVDELASSLSGPERLVGMHFFNPPTVMTLVEVVSSNRTGDEARSLVSAAATAWGKTPVHVRSSPGFVVNRVARPFYSEALLMLDQGLVAPSQLDLLLRSAGFPMGPCELMDLVGHDISLSATRSVWEATGFDARYRPSETQQSLVASGRLGRKSGRGLYVHPVEPEGGAERSPEPARPGDVVAVRGAGPLAAAAARVSGLTAEAGDMDEVVLSGGEVLRLTDGRLAQEHARDRGGDVLLVDWWDPAADRPSVAVSASAGCSEESRTTAARVLASLGVRALPVPDVPGLVVSRVLALLVDEANDLVARGVAAPQDVDTCMRLGTRYPVGPLAWGDLLGPQNVVTLLDNLRAGSGDPRYRVSGRLRLRAMAGIALASD